MSDLKHECGIVAVYHLPGGGVSPLIEAANADATSRLVPRLLLDIQNRGQLAAGMTSWNPDRSELLKTHKDLGVVTEVFRLNQPKLAAELIRTLDGPAAIGHVRYATCGKDDPGSAQPFERQHIEKSKWFSFVFNGNLANYTALRDKVLAKKDFHLARDLDTEIVKHAISFELAGNKRPTMVEMLRSLSEQFDGAYNIIFLNAVGDMVVARDPLGIRPLCYAIQGSLFAAASESIALSNMGFDDSNIRNLTPGHAVIIQNGQLTIQKFADSPIGTTSHCFFEWIYFANVASVLDEQSVYLARKRLGERLAALEDIPRGDDVIVVPVPDTAKAAADGMAFELKVPSVEGLIRNRYVGRTFIEGKDQRKDKARSKYTPLREVLENKRVLLVEDTIVRSTTMKTLVSQLRLRGKVREVHVRVACPPIVAPCFYGIDMSTVGELFATNYLSRGQALTAEVQARMAKDLGADSLRYLPAEELAACIGLESNRLCRACVSGNYPTPAGQEMYEIALANVAAMGRSERRTQETLPGLAIVN